MGFLSKDEFFEVVEEISGKRLNENQKKAISYPLKPLKVVAGPGSGKTEVLVLRALYFMTVKNLPPKSIFLVSFTRKAANELLSRIVSYCGKLKEINRSISLEPYELYCGTLHSLAARVMDEFQYGKYEKYRLISDFERQLFIYREFSEEIERGEGPFFEAFKREDDTPLSRLSLLSFLFDFLTQNMVSEESLKESSNEVLAQVGNLYSKYVKVAKNNRFLDHSLLERMFYKFLKSEEGELFLNGDGSDYFPGIRAVLVDEYQDTNPIDEKIYFKLAEGSKNLTVVGDDYQALYRFRGAVVECFINFERRCKKALLKNSKENPGTVKLLENYRSDKSIVAFINYFMKKHRKNKEFSETWKKLSTDKKVLWNSGIDSFSELKGAVFEVKGSNELLADFTAKLVKSLKDRGVIEDYSDAVLLLPSTREKDYEGKKTLAALIREKFEEEGIGVYNPRSKAFKERKEVYTTVRALLRIVPPPTSMDKELLLNLKAGKEDSSFPKDLLEELKRGLLKGELSILEAFYRLIPPLIGEFKKLTEIEKFNLARLSQLISAVENLARKEIDKFEDLEEKLRELSEELSLNVKEPEGLNNEERERWLRLITSRLLSFVEFYRSFLPLLIGGEVDQEELPEVPPGYFPLMTIHQSKGLEFPIVLVGEVDGVSSDMRLSKFEDLFKDFLPYRVENSWERSAIDAVKKFFVAYSRAIYALVILIKDRIDYDEKRPWKSAAFPGFDHDGNSKFKNLFIKRLESEAGRDS